MEVSKALSKYHALRSVASTVRRKTDGLRLCIVLFCKWVGFGNETAVGKTKRYRHVCIPIRSLHFHERFHEG